MSLLEYFFEKIIQSQQTEGRRKSPKYVECGVSIFLFYRNYPSWLFVESGTNSSSDHVGLDHDRECQGDEIVVVECTTTTTTTDQPDQGDSDSEDEGWYSLSR